MKSKNQVIVQSKAVNENLEAITMLVNVFLQRQ